MIRYESLVLTVPEITSDETTNLESQFKKLIGDHKESVISFERWGKYRLAYPVRGNDYGVYFLARFETSKEKMNELLEALKTFFMVKHNELVMRHMTHRLPANAPLSYHRPESLEEVPTRDVETFLKESKMTGLLGKGRPDFRSEGGFEGSAKSDEIHEEEEA